MHMNSSGTCHSITVFAYFFVLNLKVIWLFLFNQSLFVIWHVKDCVSSFKKRPLHSMGGKMEPLFNYVLKEFRYYFGNYTMFDKPITVVHKFMRYILAFYCFLALFPTARFCITDLLLGFVLPCKLSFICWWQTIRSN